MNRHKKRKAHNCRRKKLTNLYKKDVKEFLWLTADTPFYVFDTETTGLSHVNDDVIQFSAIKCHPVDGTYQVIEEFNTYINPGYPIPEKITELTGITDAMVAAAPDGKTAAKMIYTFLGEKPIIAGYNSTTFDQKFMSQMYKKYLGLEFESMHHLDVLKMAKEKCNGPHKLIDMAKHFGVAEKYAFHSSLDDAKATFDILNFLLPEYEKPEEKGIAVTITAIRQWKKSETLNRLYVSNKESKSIFFDIYNKEWVMPPDVDEHAIIQYVYNYYKVDNDNNLAAVADKLP